MIKLWLMKISRNGSCLLTFVFLLHFWNEDSVLEENNHFESTRQLWEGKSPSLLKERFIVM